MELISILSMVVVTVIVVITAVAGVMRWYTHVITLLKVTGKYNVYRWSLLCFTTHILTLIVCVIASITLMFFSLMYGFNTDIFLINNLLAWVGLYTLTVRPYTSTFILSAEALLCISGIFITYVVIGVTSW